MKKTYKPLANQNKTASTFRRKTIDPRVELGVKKDDDGLENIDDYWRIAGSIIESDSATETDNNPVEEQPESKRFVINSLDSNVVNDEIPSSVGFSMISVEQEKVEVKEDGESEEVKEEQESDEVKEDGESDEVKEEQESDEVKEEQESDEVKEDGESDEQDNIDVIESDEQDNVIEEEDTTLYNVEEIKERLSHKTITSPLEDSSYPQISNTSGFEVSKEEEGSFHSDKENGKQAPVKKKQVKPRKNKIKSVGLTVSKTASSFSKSFTNARGVQVGLSGVSSFYTGKSELFTLLRTDTTETAILHLNPEAKIIDDVANTDFTVYVKKGNLCVTIDGNTFDVKRDALVCVSQGEEYSLINTGRRLVEAIVTYNLMSE